ncbi:MAG: radical SAM protein [Candidatus Omnitrophota bacterium]
MSIPKAIFIYPGYENLGIEYLSASLKKAGFQTELVLDPVLFNESGFIRNKLFAKTFNFRRDVLREIKENKPDLVCFSVISDNIFWAAELAREIKEKIIVPIVFGGIHPTSVPDKVIKIDSVDFICVGEGDSAIVELGEGIIKNSKNKNVQNIWFKNEGKVITNEVRALVDDLDTLPFPDKDLYYRKYNFMFNGYTIITSRGCPHSCSFCVNSVLNDIYSAKGSYLRRRGVDNVIAELELAKTKYSPKFIHFLDEVFTYDKNWLEKFVPLYKKIINLPFACYVSPSFINEEVVGLLKEAGCYKAQMGVQTLNEDNLKNLLSREYNKEAVAMAIGFFRKNKIYLTCDNIFGLPGENKNDLMEIAEFYSLHQPNHIEVFWLRYYPRTPIIEKALKLGKLTREEADVFNSGRQSRGIASGGDTFNKESAKFQLLLNLFCFLPKPLRRLILKTKIFNYFPALNPVLVAVVSRIFNRAKFDLFTYMTIQRYRVYCLRRLSRFFGVRSY